MKLITIFLPFILLIACSNEDIESPLPQKEVLQLSISARDFVTNGTPDTRVEDNDKATVFRTGDRVGVIVLEETELKAKNLPYVYDGTKWNFDAETATKENKGIYYYNSSATDVTYIVYYPYTTNANEVTSVDGLKSTISPKPDQQSIENYRASDLMVWSSTGTTYKKLTVELAHAYASVSVLKRTQYTLISEALGTKITYNTSAFTDVAFVIDGTLYYPCQVEDGSYRYILPVKLNEADVTCFYTEGSTTYKLTLTVPASPTPNTRYAYAKAEVEETPYTYNDIQVGDLYCLTSTKKGFLIPMADKEKVKTFGLTCVGIVFKVGVGKDDELSDYETDKPAAIHGYAVALKDAHTERGAWGIRTYDVPGIENVTEANRLIKYDGYKNTKTIRKENGYATTDINKPLANSQYWAFKVASDYSVTAPIDCSGWYLPSMKQLMDIKANVSSTALTDAGGKYFITGKDAAGVSYHYWSANEMNKLDAWYYLFGDGGAGAFAKSNNRGVGDDGTDWLNNNSKSYVRAVLTF